MRRILRAIYGPSPTRASAFRTGVARTGGARARVSLREYEAYVIERTLRNASSARVTFAMSGRHFKSAAAFTTKR